MPADANGDATVELPPTPAQRIGRYEIRGVLGRGAMGVVYRAYDTVLERPVALKTHHAIFGADDPIRKRFATEVKTSSRLNHPNIVTVYDGGIETDVPFIAMELIEGTTLQAVLRERGKLPAEEALAILRPVAEALAYAHRQQIIHRDVKPPNIFLAANGQTKIGDFGVAKSLSSGPATTMLVGTPTHMAPEQLSGGTIDTRVDVFALAVVAYETLTGQVPFRGNELAQVALAVVSSEPTPPSVLEPTLPKGVDAVMARALAKDPTARYADTDVFIRDLERACHGEASAVTEVAAQRRSRFLPTLAVAFVLALAFGTLWWTTRTDLVERLPAPPAPGAQPADEAVSAPAPAEPPAVAAPASEPEPAAREADPDPAAEPAPAIAARPPADARQPETAVESAPPAAPEVVAEPPPPVPEVAGAPAPAEPATPPAAASAISSEAKPKQPSKPSAKPVSRPASQNVVSRGVPPSVPGGSSLEVKSEPPGAPVTVNGKPRGPAPIEINGLERGDYAVTVEFPGVDPQTRTVKVAGGGSRHTITFRLAAPR